MNYSKGELKSYLLKLLKEPALLTTIFVVFALLVIFIIFPLYKIFQISLTDSNGNFTLEVYKNALQNNYFRRGFVNSLLVAFLTALLGTAVGYLFAYTINRTDIPFKSFFRTIAIMPVIFPPFVGALSLIMLFGANGLITSKLLGFSNIYIYGLPGLMLAQVLCFFPVAFITLDGVLSTISPTLEDAAFNLGASRWQVFYKVVLPLSVPGIASTMLVLFIESLADFGNPLILAGSKFPILSVQAYLQITGMYDLRSGATLSVWLLIPSLLAFIIQKYFLEKKKYYTVTGKPTISVLKSVSEPVKWILFSICLFIVLFILLVYGIIFWGAFTKAWGANNQFTLDNFKYIFDVGRSAIRGTLTIASISTPISAVFGMVIAFLVVRKIFPGKRVMEFISLLSFAVPGTVIGIGYILAFNKPPLLLTGTLTILVLNFVFRYMPVGIQSGIALLNQVDPSIEEAAFTLRANNRQVFAKITLPLITPAFFSALVFAFVRAMTAISAAIFLVSSRWNLITVQILSQTESGRLSEACAFSTLLTLIIMVFIGVLKIFLKNKVSISNYTSVRG
ncbi:iron(III) transport system permease protein [Fervidobacterium changbaicum]|uniref:Iron ABC transporter permease n=3 Tax=Fervidobacterium TaxID=2422 RepID=A0A7C4RVA7_9BACT|nr:MULTISPECIES: iron ABC transporter permease [Fervidobacterium]AMW32022.1 iron ABC transporter permease [Fervidobacterium islandicum]QAV33805.1 iron ABC transporter permease [Fervidobacterium changbaicum]SDH67451.1 iron(III) transport system permease protein [Fervidobacterium changbaicum]